MLLPIVLLYLFLEGLLSIDVSNENELRAALKRVKPGDAINLKAGVYKGKFKAIVKGTKSKPITLRGPNTAILDAGNVASGYVLHLDNADYWQIEGITLRNAQKGIVLDRSNFCNLHKIHVTSIGMEGVHFRKFSSHNVIRNSTISDTGKVKPGFGEGIYVGSSMNNWDQYTDGKPDKCDYNKIIGNYIGPDVRSENVDIKEGTSHGEIIGNYFDGNGLTNKHSDKSWINLKGNFYNVKSNKGVNTIIHGFETHILLRGWGEGNVFDDNSLDLTGNTGYGIYISRGAESPNVVYSNNVANNSAKGLTNIKVTEKP